MAPVTISEDAEQEVNDIELAWAHVSASDEIRIRAARRNVNDLVEFCGVPRERYHLNGERVQPYERLVQTPLHVEFQRIWDVYQFSALMSFPGSGKTTQAIMRLLSALGHNPDLCIAVVSQNQKTEGLAAQIARTLRLTIERSRDVQRVFPHLRPGPTWTDSAWMVQKTHFSGEMTCQIVGQGNEPTGQRLDVVLADDLISGKNTRDEKDRVATSKWFRRHILDRLSARGRVIFLCNAQHPMDLFHQWEGDPHSAFKTFRFPVVDAKNEPVCPEIWPGWRISQQRDAMSAEGSSVEFDKAFLCIAREDEETIFDATRVAAAFKVNFGPVYSMDIREYPGAFIVVAVDPATRKTKTANFTAFTVGMVWPEDGTRQVLWVKAGKYKSTEIAQILFDLEVRYAPVFHVVENNAAQIWLVDIIDQWVQIKMLKAAASGRPMAYPQPRIYPYHTGVQKVDPMIGLDGLSAEIAGNRWILPTHLEDSECQVDLATLFTDIVFCRRVGHTPDRLMSLWLLREGIRFHLLWLAGKGHDVSAAMPAVWSREPGDGDGVVAAEEDEDELFDEDEGRGGHACPRCGKSLGVVLPWDSTYMRVTCESCDVVVTVVEDDSLGLSFGAIMGAA